LYSAYPLKKEEIKRGFYLRKCGEIQRYVSGDRDTEKNFIGSNGWDDRVGPPILKNFLKAKKIRCVGKKSTF
jgi:hypothetical protein